jgi:predicted site-specific integrase-resolvase
MKKIFDRNYYTLTDVQKKVGVSYMTIHRWKDKIPMVTMGHKKYITEEVFNKIEEYLSK